MKLADKVLSRFAVGKHLDSPPERVIQIALLPDELLEWSEVHGVLLSHVLTPSGEDFHPTLPGALQKEGTGGRALELAFALGIH